MEALQKGVAKVTLTNSGNVPWSEQTVMVQMDNRQHNYFNNDEFSVLVGQCNVEKIKTFDLPINAPNLGGDHEFTIQLYNPTKLTYFGPKILIRLNVSKNEEEEVPQIKEKEEEPEVEVTIEQMTQEEPTQVLEQDQL